jgi:hypothetical protein
MPPPKKKFEPPAVSKCGASFSIFFKSAGCEEFYQTMQSLLPRTIPGRKKLCGSSINARIRTMDVFSMPKNYFRGQTKKRIMTSLSPDVELQMPTNFWHFFQEWHANYFFASSGHKRICQLIL